MFSQVGRTVIGGFLCGLRLLTHHAHPAPEIRPEAQVLWQETPEVEQESLLCQLPQDILYLITENLYTKEERSLPESEKKHTPGRKSQNNLCLTCKELDRRITSPGKRIVINLQAKRKRDSGQVFLFKALHLISRMARKEGLHTLSLDLAYNGLSDDMEALQWFMECCGQEPIVSKLQDLDLFSNNLEILPSSITGLQQLQKLVLGANRLTDSVVQQIVQLVSLQELNLGSNIIQDLNPKILSLQNLKILSLDFNKLNKDCLEILTRLTKLERLNLACNHGMTLADIQKSFVAWPTKLWILAGPIEKGDNWEEICQRFRETPHVHIDCYAY